MSLLSTLSDMPRDNFPRVSGDEPWVLSFRSASDAFSPRERG